MKMKIGRRLNADIFTVLYISAYASLGALYPLIGQYLAGIGFSGTQIGLVTASATAMGIFANPFWGGIYHRRGRSKKMILILCIVTAILALPLLAVKQYTFFLLLYVVVFFFENPIFPLLDATTIEANYPFGAARKWGAVGYAFGVGIAGWVSDAFGLSVIFPLFSLFFLFTAFSFIIYRRKRRDFPSSQELEKPNEEILVPEELLVAEIEETIEGKGRFRDLFRNRPYLALLLSTFFICGPSFAHNVYFSFLYIGEGGTIAGMGIAMLLMALSEAPFMAWSTQICSKFTLERMLLIAMCVSTLRYLWYSTGPSPAFLMATFFLQGFVNGIILVETIKYIAKLVGPEMVSLAIPLYTALSSNCGTIICQILGGVIVGEYGGRGVYFFYGLFNVIGIIIYIAAGLHKSKKV